MKKIIFVLLVIIIFISCAAKVRFTPTGKVYAPYTGPVRILESMPPDLHFVEIGWVTAEGDWNNAWGDLLKLLQKEASNHGANAIVLVTSNYPRFWGGSRRSGDRSIIAKAIRILDGK